MTHLPVWARNLTKLPLRNIGISVKEGPNRGRKWSLAVTGRGVLDGRYEAGRFGALASLVRPEDVVWDIGAHYGYATLIAAGIVKSRGSVAAFEPSSLNRWYLSRHLRWNGEKDVRVLDCAVAGSDGTDVFGGSGGSIAFQLGHQGGEPVNVRSVSSLIKEGLPLPSFLKIDAEGAEVDVLEGAKPELFSARTQAARPTMLVSVHDAHLFQSCLDFMKANDYKVLGSNAISRFVNGGEAWKGDPDLLAVPPHRQAELPSMRSIPWFAEGPEW